MAGSRPTSSTRPGEGADAAGTGVGATDTAGRPVVSEGPLFAVVRAGPLFPVVLVGGEYWE